MPCFPSLSRYSQTGTILRVPHMAEGVSLVGKAGSMDERDKRMAEEFMMWVPRRWLFQPWCGMGDWISEAVSMFCNPSLGNTLIGFSSAPDRLGDVLQ